MPSWLRSVKQGKKREKLNAAQTDEPNSQNECMHNIPLTEHPSELTEHAEEHTTEDDEQELWKQAFSRLEAEDQDLMKKFKQLMENELQIAASPVSMALSSYDNWKLLKLFVNKELLKIKDSSKADRLGKFVKGLQGIQAIAQSAGAALQPVPQAAAAVAGFGVAITLLCNPMTEKMANRSGLEYICGELQWYQTLSNRLFHDLQLYQSDERMFKLGSSLKDSLIPLFKLLLAYQVQSILRLHDKHMGILRDVVKINDWKGQTDDIKIAIGTVKERIDQYKKEQTLFEMEKERMERSESGKSACLNSLNVEDPVLGKERILQSKGGLVEGCCDWIFKSTDFSRWLQDENARIIWITGEAGTGKTMLLCDIIANIEETRNAGKSFYVFCEASNAGKTAATLRSLVYTIVRQKKELIHHVHSAWKDDTRIFEGTNTLIASAKILEAILNDQLMQGTIIFIDALDECGEDLEQLLSLIRKLGNSPAVKWVLSSRTHTPRVDTILSQTLNCQNLYLGSVTNLVSDGVQIYIKRQVKGLEGLIDYEEEDMKREEIEKYLLNNANHTYLWVSLACKELRSPERLGTVSEVLRSLPKGLTNLYDRMMGRILENSPNGGRRREVMSIVLLTRRPITVEEYLLLTLPQEKLRDMKREKKGLISTIKSCGHFLIISQTDTITFVHKSAKDYLQQNSDHGLPLPGTNQSIMKQCIKLMSNQLKRDMWNLQHPGTESIGRKPATNPLDSIAYACCFWAEHLSCIGPEHNTCSQNAVEIKRFIEQHFLHWLEALSLLGAMHEGAMALWSLQEFTGKHDMKSLAKLSQDGYRFLLTFRHAIEQAPLQVYTSALLFSPAESCIKRIFKHEAPQWVVSQSYVDKQWPNYLHAIEFGDSRRMAGFSKDSKRLISVSSTGVDIRDMVTSACLRNFSYFPRSEHSTAYGLSRDATKAAWASQDPAFPITVLDMVTERWVDMSGGHDRVHHLVFSQGNHWLASSASPPGQTWFDRLDLMPRGTKIWDVESGSLLLELPHNTSTGRGFLGEGPFIAATDKSRDEKWNTIQIWNPVTKKIVKEISPGGRIKSLIPFPTDASRIISVLSNGKVDIWNIKNGTSELHFEVPPNDRGEVNASMLNVTISDNSDLIALSTAEGIDVWTLSKKSCVRLTKDKITDRVALSQDSELLVTVTPSQISVWNLVQNILIMKFEHYGAAGALMASFSPDNTRLAIPYYFDTKVWDLRGDYSGLTEDNEPPGSRCDLIYLSRDSKWLVTIFNGMEVNIWKASGEFERNLVHLEKKRNIKVCFSWSSKMLAFSYGKSQDHQTIFCTSLGSPGTDIETHHISLPSSSHSSYPSISGLEFSRDDTHIAVIYYSPIVKVFKIKTGEYFEIGNAGSMNPISHHITSVVMFENGQLVSVNYDGKIRLWDTKTGDCLKQISNQGEERPSDSVIMRHINGTPQVISSSRSNKELTIWNLDTGECIQTIRGIDASPLGFAQNSNTVISTHLGYIDLKQFGYGQTQVQDNLENISIQGYGLKRSEWITKNGQNLIWLPPNYRPKGRRYLFHKKAFAYTEFQIAIACEVGSFLLMEFSKKEV
ncbi:hypothetical protein H0G86_005200 [Trichoderma simmonsii]|uniref:NACHT domain-containing protein n=1 Tax=Trichoderma simmonsii TaxID=1491479 RepID=A0A8G0LE51_9HYPO|nr:hypothetical protein H0G86_005200 [Trichoderma simmonsii]